MQHSIQTLKENKIYSKKPDFNEYMKIISNIQKRIYNVISDNDKEIKQLADRLNANKEISYTNEYSVENYFHIGNGRYVAKEQYKPAEDSVYGNVTGYKRLYTKNIE